MNKCVCSSIIRLILLKPCTMNDITAVPFPPPHSCSPVTGTNMHSNINHRYRWPLLCVVMKT